MHLRLAALSFALCSAFVAPSICLADTVTGVTFTGSPVNPTITITGSGFGNTPPPISDPAVGTGFNYGTLLYLDDNSAAFSTGYEDLSAGRFDFIGLILLNYSDTSITFQLGNFYSIGGYDLASGDIYTVGVGDTTFSGTVAYTPEPSSLALLGTGVLGVVGTVRRRLLKT